MRAPFDIDMIGQSLRKSTVFKQFPRMQSGWYETVAGGTRRASDLGVRYGGEECAVLLPGETGQGAFRIAEEIRASVLSLRLQQQGRPDICPTISVGVASMVPQVGLTPSDLIKSADLALYEAKRSGRNRTVAAPTMASAHRVAA